MPFPTAEEESKKLTAALEEMQVRVTKAMLPVEKKAAQCALDCYGDLSDPNAVHNCAQRCQSSLERTGKRIQNELQALQTSTQSCQQSVLQRLNPQMEMAQNEGKAWKIKNIEAAFNEGLTRCFKEALEQLPGIEARTQTILKER
mmetsp:Transcript_31241/g.50363  ORF Transcript_31241/g.50363 Transcript_31241/m.50363 type:complete len:145 (-) Transcript_31241:35-469(-)